MWLDWHSQGCGGGDHKLTRGRHYACSIAAALPLLFCHCKIPNVVHSRLSLSDFLKWLCWSSSFLKLYVEENYWNLWNVSNFQILSSNRRQIARLCFQWREAHKDSGWVDNVDLNIFEKCQHIDHRYGFLRYTEHQADMWVLYSMWANLAHLSLVKTSAKQIQPRLEHS